MRVREWYGWHFPELAKIVADNFQYARVVMLAKDKSSISDEMVDDLKGIVGDQDIAEQVCMRSHACVQLLWYSEKCAGLELSIFTYIRTNVQVVQAAKASMGQDISPVDLANIELFAKRVISLAEYRQKLFTYLHDRMHAVAPNLSALIGEVIGARLISHAGLPFPTADVFACAMLVGDDVICWHQSEGFQTPDQC